MTPLHHFTHPLGHSHPHRWFATGRWPWWPWERRPTGPGRSRSTGGAEAVTVLGARATPRAGRVVSQECQCHGDKAKLTLSGGSEGANSDSEVAGGRITCKLDNPHCPTLCQNMKCQHICLHINTNPTPVSYLPLPSPFFDAFCCSRRLRLLEICIENWKRRSTIKWWWLASELGVGALRCGHATLQRKGSLGAVQHVQIYSSLKQGKSLREWTGAIQRQENKTYCTFTSRYWTVWQLGSIQRDSFLAWPRSNWTSKSWSVSSRPWDICKVYLAISWR